MNKQTPKTAFANHQIVKRKVVSSIVPARAENSPAIFDGRKHDGAAAVNSVVFQLSVVAL